MRASPPRTDEPIKPASAAEASEEAAAEGKGSRPVIRYFRSCTAYIPEQQGDIERDRNTTLGIGGGGGGSSTPIEARVHLAKRCTWQSGRWPKERKAEIELQEHALAKHSESGQKRVVVKREEVDV
jgi:hypothetical protein